MQFLRVVGWDCLVNQGPVEWGIPSWGPFRNVRRFRSPGTERTSHRRAGYRIESLLRVVVLLPILASLPVYGDPGLTGNTGDLREIKGTFGADLNQLNRFYTPPIQPGENNHLFDMWAGPKLSLYTRGAGLTNNHALIINSHGVAAVSGHRRRHALCPHESLTATDASAPLYSPKDFARFLGPAVSDQIHNIVLSACDAQALFEPGIWRAAFANVTNIIHVPAGEAGYQPMFLQVLFSHSTEIEPLFEVKRKMRLGTRAYDIQREAARRSKRLPPYIADLYRPGGREPYRKQIAGRELLVIAGADHHRGW